MTGQADVLRLPVELADDWEALACLQERPGCRTLLVQRADGEKRAVLKCAAEGREALEETYHLLQCLSGPDVPDVYGWGRDGEEEWLLRAYVPGETLLDYLQKRGPLPTEEVLAVGLDLCRVIKRLHEQEPPVIHRDIKAENVIRTSDGRYILIDYGTIRRFDSAARRDTRVLGTPASAPPEQFGYRQTDARSDIYAIGVLLHELATGESDLDRGTPAAPLRAIISRCTRFAPEARYASAAALERALNRAVRYQNRQPARWLLLLLPLLLLCGLLWTAWGKNRAELPDKLYRFADAAIEREVCRQLGKGPGTITNRDLEAVESILLLGDTPFQSWEQLNAYGQNVQLDYTFVDSRGGVRTLRDIPKMKNLRTLALCNQEIQDISPLAGCALERLALHGNQISDLSALGSCSLLLELFISGNPVSDLSPLEGCPNLWKLNAGGTPLKTVDSLSGCSGLYALYLHDCGELTDLTGLEDLSGLTALQFNLTSQDLLEDLQHLINLECLGLWGSAGMTDLTALSPLTHLTWLYIDMTDLISLQGVNALQDLQLLDICCYQALDISATSELKSLQELGIRRVAPVSWEPLAEIHALKRVRCPADQSGAVRQVLGGREVEIDPTG